MIRPPGQEALQPQSMEFLPYSVFTEYMERQNTILTLMQSKIDHLSARMSACEQRVDDLSKICLKGTDSSLSMPPILTAKRKEADSAKEAEPPKEIPPVKILRTTEEAKTVTLEELVLNPVPYHTVKHLEGESAAPGSIVTLEKSTRVIDKSGILLCVFLKNVLNYEKHQSVFMELDSIATKKKNTGSTLRGHAAGKFEASTHNKKDSDFKITTKNQFKAVSRTINPDGSEKLGTFQVGNRHPSITFGYLGHSRSYKKSCGLTGNSTEQLVERMGKLLEDVSGLYERYAPKHFNIQKNLMDDHKRLADQKGIKHFQMGKSPFTSITVNETNAGKPTTYFHKDSQNVKDSFVVITTSSNEYEGGETVIANFVHPETGKMIAFKIMRGDLLFIDGTAMLHGNTPLISGKRISYVFYANSILAECTRCELKPALPNVKSAYDDDINTDDD